MFSTETTLTLQCYQLLIFYCKINWLIKILHNFWVPKTENLKRLWILEIILFWKKVGNTNSLKRPSFLNKMLDLTFAKSSPARTAVFVLSLCWADLVCEVMASFLKSIFSLFRFLQTLFTKSYAIHLLKNSFLWNICLEIFHSTYT